MVCYNMRNPDGTPRVDAHGRCLVYLVTNDPDLWPRIMDMARRFGDYARAVAAQPPGPPVEPS